MIWSIYFLILYICPFFSYDLVCLLFNFYIFSLKFYIWLKLNFNSQNWNEWLNVHQIWVIWVFELEQIIGFGRPPQGYDMLFEYQKDGYLFSACLDLFLISFFSWITNSLLTCTQAIKAAKEVEVELKSHLSFALVSSRFWRTLKKIFFIGLQIMEDCSGIKSL